MGVPRQTEIYRAPSLAIAFCAIGVSTLSLFAQNGRSPIHSEITHVGTAEVRSIDSTGGFDPDSQPDVYWHDDDWKLDLVKPTSDRPYSVAIVPGSGSPRAVALPDSYLQIDSLSRGPSNKGLVVAEQSGAGVMAIGILDLKSVKLIDDVALIAPSFSPDRRFVIYINGYGAHSPWQTDDQYRLYDLLRTPVENTCGYRENDPEHKSLDEGWRGQPVYSLKRDEIFRPNEDADLPSEKAHQMVGQFAWSPDSRKVIFADTQGSVISLILAMMPPTPQDLPTALVYKVPGQGKPCANNCPQWGVKSLNWQGDTIEATLLFTPPRGPRQTKVLALSQADFTPAER